MTPFEVVYGFNLLTPLDLTPLSQDFMLSPDGSKLAEAMKNLQEKVWLDLEKKNQEVSKRANKGLLERLNDNSYKVTLPSEYQVHNTFNVCDLSSFPTIDDDDPSNLRTNSFQEEENDAIRITSRPFTRSQA
ncbi:hypothetical protein MTR67_017906 [Solanum verrucosum]|uniref:Uncharacterized protein n=1 Tax=Solanum verrucosum TaxID=315347 RepID=A0AAF0QPU0_SOLVR|nr:hypothetical protein MTR67_017906 [Solanum verrucosum]